jgi:hypothetical protein
MNGYESEESFDSVADLLDDIESEESEESIESEERTRPRSRPIRPRVPSGRGLFRPRPPIGAGGGNYVTQVQLQSALTRVGAQIKTSADATKALSGRVNTISQRVDDEATARKKDVAAIKKEVSSARQMGILPLLLTSTPELTEITIAGTTSPASAKFKRQDNLLPLVLLMGSGGLGGSGDSKGSDDNMMMMMAVLLSSQR